MTIDHPFIQPLTELTMDELDKKYADLMQRWRTARGMNMESNVLHQFDLLLSSIEEERYKRLMAEERPNGVVIDTDPIQNLPNVPADQTKIVPNTPKR
jgi:hypothetical protein